MLERGFKAEDSIVTVINAEAPHSMTENVQTDPIEIMRTFADTMATYGGNNLYSQGHPVVVLGVEHAQHIAAAGWCKKDVQMALFQMARRPWGIAKNRGKSKGPFFPVWVDKNDENAMVPIINEPKDLGGDRGRRRGRQIDVVPDRGRAEPKRQQGHRARGMTAASSPVGAPADAQSPTMALAEFAAHLRSEDLPAAVVEILGVLFLDYLRVASITGAEMAWSGWARDYMLALGRHGAAPVLFDANGCDPVGAAFLNTTYAGSIDADDTHVGSMHCIPDQSCSRRRLQVAGNASGGDFIAAVAAGYLEAMIRIGLSIQPTHFRRGFQSTATCGGFGAAVAASRLLFGRDAAAAQRIAETVGLVASFSGGLTQFYQSGSTVKRIHAARAAE